MRQCWRGVVSQIHGTYFTYAESMDSIWRQEGPFKNNLNSDWTNMMPVTFKTNQLSSWPVGNVAALPLVHRHPVVSRDAPSVWLNSYQSHLRAEKSLQRCLLLFFLWGNSVLLGQNRCSRRCLRVGSAFLFFPAFQVESARVQPLKSPHSSCLSRIISKVLRRQHGKSIKEKAILWKFVWVSVQSKQFTAEYISQTPLRWTSPGLFFLSYY